MTGFAGATPTRVTGGNHEGDADWPGADPFREKEGVFKVSAARSDLSVTVAGVHLTPPMGLTSWAAFKEVGRHTTVMGDLVLLEDQVNPVMSAALDNGLEVTALHNHFFWDTPKVMFMHIGGCSSRKCRVSSKPCAGLASTSSRSTST